MGIKRIKILIAEDHPVFRNGIKYIFKKTEDMEVVADVDNGDEVLPVLRSSTVDVVLMDIGLPGKNGLEVLCELKKEFSELPVLALSVYPVDRYGVRMIQAGAAGYLLKSCPPPKLLEAVRTVVQGKPFLSPELKKILSTADKNGTGISGVDRLTRREYQVMFMIASGKTVSEIARELSLSVATVSGYRSNILEKMNFKNNAQITHFVLSKDLLE